jgi:hypothetical protein
MKHSKHSTHLFSFGGLIAKTLARMLAAAMMKCMWAWSDESKSSGVGKRFGGDQNGSPLDVRACA